MEDDQSFWEAYQEYRKGMILRRFGSEILALSTNDEELLACVASGDPERQRMALGSPLELRFTHNPVLVEKCAQYFECGEHRDITVACLTYLDRVVRREHDEPVTKFLEGILRRLGALCRSVGAAAIIQCIMDLLSLGHRRKKPFGKRS